MFFFLSSAVNLFQEDKGFSLLNFMSVLPAHPELQIKELRMKDDRKKERKKERWN